MPDLLKPKLPGFKRLIRWVYLKLFRINDSPQRVAFGLGLGVFSGIMPGTGPIAALFLAMALRANRASALLGSILTNTWFSILIAVFSVKAGAKLLGLDWVDLHLAWKSLLKDFSFYSLFQLSAYKVILAVTLGYLFIAFSLAMITYIGALIILLLYRRWRKTRVR